MRRLSLPLIGLLTLAVPAFAGMPGATPAAPGNPRFVQMSTLEGLPKEPAARAAFLEAFQMTFAEDAFALEAEYERVDPRRPGPTHEVTLARFHCTADGQNLPSSPAF